MKLLHPSNTLLAAGLLQFSSASDLRDESGDVWKDFLSRPSVGSRDEVESGDNVWKDFLHTPTVDKRQSAWAPPANLVKPLQEVWDHQVKTYTGNGGWDKFRNYGYDILMASNGYVNLISYSHSVGNLQ